MKRKTVYFDEPSSQNTDTVIQVIKERLKNSRIRYVVATSESYSPKGQLIRLWSFNSF